MSVRITEILSADEFHLSPDLEGRGPIGIVRRATASTPREGATTP